MIVYCSNELARDRVALFASKLAPTWKFVPPVIEKLRNAINFRHGFRPITAANRPVVLSAR